MKKRFARYTGLSGSLRDWMAREGSDGLVSVVVPTYNRADLLRESLRSLWEQTYRPMEVLVVDDGSTDATGRVLRDWEEASSGDPWLSFRCWRQENRGAAAARNLALSQATGEHIQFLDSDDLLDPDKLSRQVEVMRSGDWDFVWSDRKVFQNHPREAVVDRSVAGWSAPLEGFVRSRSLPWDCEAGLYSRRLCRAVGPWNERLTCWQDWEYNVRVLCLDPAVKYVPGAYNFVRKHEGERITDLSTGRRSATGRWMALRSAQQVLEETGHMTREFRSEFAKHYVDVARRAGAAGCGLLSREALRRARQNACSGVSRLEVMVFESLWRNFGLTAASRALGFVQDEHLGFVTGAKDLLRS